MVGHDLEDEPEKGVVPAQGAVTQAKLISQPDQQDSRGEGGQGAAHDHDLAEHDVLEGQIVPLCAAVLPVGVKQTQDGEKNGASLVDPVHPIASQWEWKDDGCGGESKHGKQVRQGFPVCEGAALQFLF
ncbi:MAG: hypothetical protein EBS49_03305 [Verrucomicrobia bacterium]|nr:hypothetical protein [Verrucomicrobiota bacterium]